MKSFLEALRSNMLAQAVTSIALGIFLAFWPGVTILTVVYLLALYLAVSGVASLVAYFRSSGARYRSAGVLANAILLLVLALLVFLFPEAVGGFFSFILGILLTIGGIVNAVRSVELRAYQGSTWVVTLILSAIIAIGGLVIIVNPFATTAMFVLVLGVLLIVKGVADLVIERRLARMMKEAR
ncbi:DUF308 domain-containing protein [Eggerthella timonensis]|uniref:DUF308 domain-containing protein n=1 Tax=Eggerthella timonensis TaxID=1871008 RepID=UPI000C76B5CA|nr:DUF308 domain-containing protein [Eggerthella timonensis]